MTAKTEKEIYALADEFIDKNFPTPLGNKKNVELRDRQAIERTMIFAAAYGMGLTHALEIFKS